MEVGTEQSFSKGCHLYRIKRIIIGFRSTGGGSELHEAGRRQSISNPILDIHIPSGLGEVLIVVIAINYR